MRIHLSFVPVAVFVGTLVSVAMAISGSSTAAAAYCGTGYFTGNTGCTDLSYSDDVFSGRTSGSSPDAVPDWSAN